MDKQFSFIIVNYNYLKEIKALIESIQRFIPENSYEIIIVDNASSDGSNEYFSSLNEKIKYFYLEENIGYGAANNLGVKMSKTARLVLINPDTLIQQNDFHAFVNLIDDDEAGVLAPKVIYSDGKNQPNCTSYATLKTFILQSLKVGYYLRKYNLVYKLQKLIDHFTFLQKNFIGIYLNNFSDDFIRKECDWVSGACMVIKKSVFDEVSGFDENFFLYCEDEDLCRRIAAKGYKIFIDRRNVIIHNEGFAKVRKNKALTSTEKFRHQSSIYYLDKHVSSTSALFLRFFYAFQYFIMGLFYIFFDYKSSKTYFGAIKELFIR